LVPLPLGVLAAPAAAFIRISFEGRSCCLLLGGLSDCLHVEIGIHFGSAAQLVASITPRSKSR
jgi:hypothetical protein